MNPLVLSFWNFFDCTATWNAFSPSNNLHFIEDVDFVKLFDKHSFWEESYYYHRLCHVFPTTLFSRMIVTSVELRDSLRFISISNVQLVWIMCRWFKTPLAFRVIQALCSIVIIHKAGWTEWHLKKIRELVSP